MGQFWVQINKLLTDWERVAGLPESCTTETQTLQERRAALHTKLTATGGQSRAYFISLAAALGFTITITEFIEPSFQAGISAAGEALTNGWRYYWRVNAPETTVTAFTAGSGAAGDPLRSWGNELLECAITKLTPAHTTVFFAYGG